MVNTVKNARADDAADGKPRWRHRLCQGIQQNPWVKETALVALATFAIYAIMTWPLILHFTDRLPGMAGKTDVAITLWDFWWFQAQPHTWFPNPYYTDMMFYPLGGPLVYHGTLFFYAALTAPVGWLFGTVAAVNASCLWTFLASAVACYWLCRYLGLSRSGSWLAALLFAFSSYRLWRITQHTNYLSTEWFAGYALCLMALPKTRRWGLVGLITGLCMTGCMYADSTFTVLLVILSALFVVASLRLWRSPVEIKRILLGFATAVLTASLLTLPITVGLKHISESYNYYIERGNISLSADLLGFVSPPEGSIVADALRGGPPTTVYTQEGVTFLGFTALALVLVGLFWPTREKGIRFWKMALIVFFVISLGPFLKVGGEVDLFEGTWGQWGTDRESFRLTLPYAFFSYIPLVNNARGPSRFHGMTTLPFSIIAAFGFAMLTTRIISPRKTALVAIVVAAVCLAENAVFPLETFKPRWDAMQAVRDDPNDVAVLDGAINQRDPIEHQVRHNKRILTGHVGRIPPEVHGYLEATPLIREFASSNTAQSEVLAFRNLPNAGEISQRVLKFLDIGYFVVNGPAEQYKRSLFDGFVPYHLAGSAEDVNVYKFDLQPEGGLQPKSIAVGRDEWNVYFAHGWGQWKRTVEARDGKGLIWPGSPMASLLFRTDKPQTVRAAAETYLPATCPSVPLQMFLNGSSVGQVEVPQGFAKIEMAFSRDLVRKGLNEIELRWPLPNDLYPLGDSTGIPPILTLSSGASGKQFVSGALEILGQVVYTNERGYNIVQLSDNARRVLSAACFDPYADPQAWPKMQGYIRDIPQGRLVAFMASNEASKNLSEEAVAALRSLGSRFDMRGKAAWAHAGLGYKGMETGQALETFSGESVVFLVPGRCAFSSFQFSDDSAAVVTSGQ